MILRNVSEPAVPQQVDAASWRFPGTAFDGSGTIKLLTPSGVVDSNRHFGINRGNLLIPLPLYFRNNLINLIPKHLFPRYDLFDLCVQFYDINLFSRIFRFYISG
ncbi:MAG: hypothetical protein LUD14_11095 [Clostridiales bacterium]|nr:hypothetical protein [Clostridiales bacterium]